MRVGPFELEAELGRGGMGAVWAATHRLSGTPIALKVALGEDAESRTAFEREISAIATLHHPGVARVLDRGVAGPGDALPEGSPWFVLERAEGTLATTGPLPWPEARALLVALLEALGHAHGHGVLHRDLKPANVLRIRGRWALADFGMAGLADAAGRRGGTPGFTAPEQAAGQGDEGPWTDLWALGRLASGAVAGAAPAGLLGWCAAALEPDPRRRFRSAAEARLALEQVSGPAIPMVARPESPVEPTRPSAEVASLEDALPAVRHPRPAPGPLPERWLPPPLPAALGAHLLDARTGPVLGRDAERRALWQAFQGVARTDAPASVALVGPSGVGKTRLARWIAAEAHARAGAVVVRVRGSEPDALRAGLRRALGGAERARLTAALRDLQADEVESAPLLDWLSGASVGPADGVARAVATVNALARRGPLVWVLDDAHALEEHERAGLVGLEGPVLAIATHRPDRADLPTGFMAVALGPLGDEAVLEMLEGIVGLSPSLAAEVAGRSGGNPRIAALRLAGPLARRELVAGPDGWRLAPGGALDPPEDEVRAWERALTAHVPEGAERHVALAALLEEPFSRSDWERLAGGAVPLAALVRGQVLQLDADGLRWTHGLLREAALAGARRQGTLAGLHARILEDLRATGATDPALLGRHALGAGRPEEAAPLLRRALFLAVSATRMGEADALDRLLDQALDALPAPHPLRPEHLLERARLAWLRRRDEQALAGVAAARDALSLAGDPAFAAVLCWLEGMVHTARGALRDARTAVEAGLAHPGCSPTLRSRLTRMLARIARGQGDGARARDLLDGELERARAAGDTQGELDAHLSLGVLWQLGGDLPRARAHYEATIALAESSGADFGLVEGVLNLADLARWEGDLEAARAGIERAARIGRRIGRSDKFVLLSRARLAFAEGDEERAWAILEAAASGGETTSALHLLEREARRGDGAGWDARWAVRGSELEVLDPELLEGLRRALAEARRRGWVERARELEPTLEALASRLGALRASLSASPRPS